MTRIYWWRPRCDWRLPQVARAVELAFERWQRGGRVVLFGAGTSGRLAALDAAELGPTFGTPAQSATWPAWPAGRVHC